MCHFNKQVLVYIIHVSLWNILFQLESEWYERRYREMWNNVTDVRGQNYSHENIHRLPAHLADQRDPVTKSPAAFPFPYILKRKILLAGRDANGILTGWRRRGGEEKFTLWEEGREVFNQLCYMRKVTWNSRVFFFFFFFFCFFRTTPVAYGGSQARDPIRATAASLCQSHSFLMIRRPPRSTP